MSAALQRIAIGAFAAVVHAFGGSRVTATYLSAMARGTNEQLAGFYLVDARDLNEAIQIAAQIPPARVGSIEVRPVRQLTSTTGERRQI